MQKRYLLDAIKIYDTLVLTDINHKIVWASSGFQSMTDYKVSKAIVTP